MACAVKLFGVDKGATVSDSNSAFTFASKGDASWCDVATGVISLKAGSNDSDFFSKRTQAEDGVSEVSLLCSLLKDIFSDDRVSVMSVSAGSLF